ncbi:DUF6680 family protein [Azospirillum sp. B4]|uniref:DUF6680 family protein n=1 Tax=Azospirillum sp. B4 TaxID=95605 RepID=UPI0011DD9A04|nr:DUF6680 family protein [Azospirillum sp. B4]
MSNADIIALSNIIITTISVFSAPIVALWIGGIIQSRSEKKKNKLQILGVLLANRHDMISQDSVRALNLIDIVFSNDRGVREAWSRYCSAMSAPEMNNPLGWSIQHEKRRDLLIEMAKAVGDAKNISTSDLLRAYMPKLINDQAEISFLENSIKLQQLRKAANELGIQNPAHPDESQG